MKLFLGISAAILLAVTQAAALSKPDEMLKIPIETFNGPVRPSTMGRWSHALRKYGLSQRHSQHHHPKAGGGPRGRQRGRVDDETNLARIPLVDYDFDREYYGTVMIGTPPQAFKIDFDTGSSQFIISSKDCTQCSGTTHYDSSASHTFRANGKPWAITYGDQSHASGFLGHDQILLDNIRVKNQQLALVTSESAGFDDTIDGIMGLAFGKLSRTVGGTRTVFENMMDQGLVERGVFAFYLGKASRGGGGEVMFGGMDLSRVEEGEKVTWTEVTKAKYWQIDIEDVFVDGEVVALDGKGEKKKGKKSGRKMEAIMDTGTTLMIVPEALAESIHEQIPGAQELGTSWALPCDLALSPTSSTSKVELQISNKRFGIPFEDLVREETDIPGVCYSGIQSSTAGFMIIGDVFIKNNYVVFDQEKRRVGIAPLKVRPKPAPEAFVEVGVQNAGGADSGEGEEGEDVVQAAGVEWGGGTEEGEVDASWQEQDDTEQRQIDASKQASEDTEVSQTEEEANGDEEEEEEEDGGATD
ncbi:aspartic peptidase domain-containing protein [Linnemannia elongata]|nr:aspartic peptidase domain-containing protein [Linnemannia elongata]